VAILLLRDRSRPHEPSSIIFPEDRTQPFNAALGFICLDHRHALRSRREIGATPARQLGDHPDLCVCDGPDPDTVGRPGAPYRVNQAILIPRKQAQRAVRDSVGKMRWLSARPDAVDLYRIAVTNTALDSDQIGRPTTIHPKRRDDLAGRQSSGEAQYRERSGVHSGIISGGADRWEGAPSDRRPCSLPPRTPLRTSPGSAGRCSC
jgi:hypothetical protein